MLENLARGLTYSLEALEDQYPRIEPFVLAGISERGQASCDESSAVPARADGVQESTGGPPQPESIQIYCLHLQGHQRELIERKVARNRTGRRVGDLMHARREDATCAEIRERLAWIREMAWPYRKGTQVQTEPRVG